ncbi:MAG: polysaccharide deacetylase family protein [Chloroflexi bacterium]|nr:polysaccharide deacetylase family protein [Chloroflexota bacterium]
MPAERKLGMDTDLYTYSSLVTRTPIRWPDGARLALWPIVHAEHFELAPPESFPQPKNLGRLPMAFPDFRHYTLRDYGNRWGIFRIMRLLDRYGLRATLAVNSVICDRHPYIIEQALQRKWEVIPAGTHATRIITSAMPEADEREYLQTAISTVARATGKQPAGWISPELSESLNTPRLLAELGIRYVCDWVNDEQPYEVRTEAGPLVAMPYSVEVSDLTVLAQRKEPVMDYERMLRRQFEGLYREGERHGLVMALPLHSWLVGQPYRTKYLDRALQYICSYAGVWNATGVEIADHFVAATT